MSEPTSTLSPQQAFIDNLIKEAESKDGHALKRELGPVGLTLMGIGAIIGTGIFVLVGKAAHDQAGPALMLSFVVAGLACVFAALCYAEFASMVPIAGSAYTYARVTVGPLFAWIVGWNLLLEYSIAASTVAHGWSKYFQALLTILHNKMSWVPTMYPQLADAPIKYAIDGSFARTNSWFDLPAFLITWALTAILIVGIKESARFNAVMVAIKVLVVLFVIVVGVFYIDPANWRPFAPYGYSGFSLFGFSLDGSVNEAGKPVGMLAGASIIFFAYIGFDAVSTQSEEAKNPKRDVPIGIIASLIICTILYIIVVAVLTGMVKYSDLHKDAPVSDAFKQKGLEFAEFVIATGALTGITSVLLVLLLSQPRILMAMARDGVIPRGFFSAIHPKFRTPWKATLLTGLFVSLAGSLLPLDILAELTSIGTLFAFTMVCAAVLVMRQTNPELNRPFKTPLYPVIPILGIVVCFLLMCALPGENWLRLIVWVAIGLAVFYGYSRYHLTSTASAINPTGK